MQSPIGRTVTSDIPVAGAYIVEVDPAFTKDNRLSPLYNELHLFGEGGTRHLSIIQREGGR